VPAYRYLLCDLLTDQPIAQLPLSGVSFDRRLCRTGSLTATLDATNQHTATMARLVHRYAGRAALWVYRGDALWWGGIPWTVQPKQGQRGGVSVSITAATFDSYAHHRLLYADATYAGIDQGVIIPDLWRLIQADPSGDIGVLAVDQLTGVLRDRTYLASEHNFAGKLIEDLGDVIDGPEHTIRVYPDADGNRIKELVVASTIGLTTAQTVFQRSARGGGRALEWERTADAIDGGTAFQTRGDTPNGNVGEDVEPALSARVYRDDLLAEGWPLLDVVEDRAGVTEASTLDGYAEGLADQRGGAMPVASYSVQVDGTGWSPNRLGDPVRIKLADLWHTPAVDLTVRPVGCQVTAPEGSQPETVKLILDGDDE